MQFILDKHRGKEKYVSEFTYGWLKTKLASLTDEQLKQPVQIFGPETSDHTKMVLLKPVYSFGTIEELCHVDGEIDSETRGPDFAHHPEQVVICVDYAPWSQLGDTMYTMEDGGMRGNVTGKLFDNFSDKEIESP